MFKELSAKEIVYSIGFDKIVDGNRNDIIPEYKENVYKDLEDAFEIDSQGFDVYLIDEVSVIKIDKLKKYLENLISDRKIPKDICYVIKDSVMAPRSLTLKAGNGNVLKEELEKLQKRYYDIIFDFYNTNKCEDKEQIIEDLQAYRTKLIEALMDKAHANGFDIKSSFKGFAFIPMNKDEEVVTEEDFDLIETKEKAEILEKVEKLKEEARSILDTLKEEELIELDKLKEYFRLYLEKETIDFKAEVKIKFEDDLNAFEYLEYVYCNIDNMVVTNYTMSFEDDENSIKEILLKYDMNVFFDASKLKSPRVIFENDPTLSNLFGNIEYESKNGTYQSEISMITAGSIVEANGGCLIIDVNNLISYPKSYSYLKKFIEEGKVKLDYNKNYLDLLTVNPIKPEAISIKEKIILVGNMETYNILYNYDRDFKKLFKLKVEYDPVVDIGINNQSLLKNILNNLCYENHYNSLDDNSYAPIAKYLSRKAENKNKLYFDIEKINDILVLSNKKRKELGKKSIDEESLVFPDMKNCIVEKHVDEMYKNNHILINVNDGVVGQINGLSVIEVNDYVMGKPIKITCTCYKGDGCIIDVQKESELSGKIHSKAINTLNGLINNRLKLYTKIPVNFHLSFEQVYGKIDGDSASVAEYLAMISSLSNVPIKQNIAVTGSLNQFGSVQSIGGVNEKIEGFFNICKVVDTAKNKGVLIPNTNKENLVLNKEVEMAIKNKEFHIYVMESIEDAVEVLMGNYEEVMGKVRKEIKKYSK